MVNFAFAGSDLQKLLPKQKFLGVRDHGTFFSKWVLVAEGI